MDILLKLRGDLEELSNALDSQLGLTEKSIEEASKTWNDEKFREFKASFETDKDLLKPLSSQIREFNDGFLRDTINRLEDYLR